MSFALYPCEVERGEKRLASLGQPSIEQANFFVLNFRQVHGAQVALLQSPILRLLRQELNRPANERNPSPHRYEKRTVTAPLRCVTNVLSQECYRCPDCAHLDFLCHLCFVICHWRSVAPQRNFARASTVFAHLSPSGPEPGKAI
jgi:hypothetical protein